MHRLVQALFRLLDLPQQLLLHWAGYCFDEGLLLRGHRREGSEGSFPLLERHGTQQREHGCIGGHQVGPEGGDGLLG